MVVQERYQRLRVVNVGEIVGRRVHEVAGTGGPRPQRERAPMAGGYQRNRIYRILYDLTGVCVTGRPVWVAADTRWITNCCSR